MDVAVEAPLIQPSSPTDSRDESTTGERVEGDVQRPSRFVWSLTAAAGISGLLFGYE